MKHALARHLDVVEDDERVLLVEAGRQRMVERIRVRASTRCRGTGRSAPACPSGSRSSARTRAGASAAADGRGTPRSRRRTARASRGCARRARRCRARFRRPCAAAPGCPANDVVRRSVDRRVDDRVRERDVFARELLLEAARGCRRPRSLPPSAPSQRTALAREAGERDVHVVGRAAHQADRSPRRCARSPLVPPLQVLPRAGDHVADVDRLAGLRDPASGSRRGTRAAGRTPRPACAAPARPGWSTTSSTRSPPSHTSRLRALQALQELLARSALPSWRLGAEFASDDATRHDHGSASFGPNLW